MGCICFQISSLKRVLNSCCYTLRENNSVCTILRRYNALNSQNEIHANLHLCKIPCKQCYIQGYMLITDAPIFTRVYLCIYVQILYIPMYNVNRDLVLSFKF